MILFHIKGIVPQNSIIPINDICYSYFADIISIRWYNMKEWKDNLCTLQ